MSGETHFLLNDHTVRTTAPGGRLVLDFLRGEARRTGTKEGCREGDCGACTVLVGELGDGDRVTYRPVTSCLMPLGELHGKHLVTVEGLCREALTPVQQAIVDQGASQCGFCTPGIVVSLTGLLLDKATPVDADGLKMALSGHLCRCTGYRSLKACGTALADAAAAGRDVPALIGRGVLPEHFRGVSESLRRIPPRGAGPVDADAAPVVVAGGTDLYVQRGDEVPEQPVELLSLHPEMRGTCRRGGQLRIGALTSFEDFARHPEVVRLIPTIREHMFLVASWQIRNRATLGGNIVNASPIGDMTILLLALGARLVLIKGEHRRELPLADFYLGYKRLALLPGEVLTEILLPAAEPPPAVHFEKVAKRQCLDIASVCSAIRVRQEGGAITEVGLAAGGVAPIPLFLTATCEHLRGQPLSRQTIADALDVAQSEIAPISDVRGSAAYKRLLVRQQLIAHFIHLFPETLSAEDFYP